MSWILKLNGVQRAVSGNWNPNTFTKETGSSFPASVPNDWSWSHNGWSLAWEADPAPPEPTPEEIANAALQALNVQLNADTKASAVFSAIKGKTFAEVSTYIDTQFSGLTAAQRNVLKVMACAAVLYLQNA